MVVNMASILKKKENEEQSNGEEEPLLVLRGLEKEEISLMEEKRDLLAWVAQPYSLSWTADSTHITIYHSAAGSLTVTCYCEYKP